MNFTIITGLSGAGRSTALKALEDLGFFCSDNIPPALIPSFAKDCICLLYTSQLIKDTVSLPRSTAPPSARYSDNFPSSSLTVYFPLATAASGASFK